MRTAPLRFLAPLLVIASFLGAAASPTFAATPFPMASGNYFENFDGIAGWSNNFASGTGAQYWASVGVNATGTIPDGAKITVSTAAFVSGTSGGVQKGSGNIQLLSTNGTDNINADAIDLFLDFTGMNAGFLSYDFATAFNSTGNRNGSLRVYTSIDGTTWTELAAASVVNFTNNVAFSQQVSLVQLPAAFTNSPTARIRFYDYNGTGPSGSTGARPKASIDNVAVTGSVIGSGGPGGPQMAGFSTIPSTPLDTTAVTVQASVVDTARALNAVSLAWGLSNASLPNIISMEPASGNFWQTSVPIPVQVGGTVVYYQITAADDSVTVQSPVLSYTVTGTGGGSTSAPVIKSVFESSDSTLQVFFSVPVDPTTSQTPGNYSVNGNVAVNAVRDPVQTSQVTITVRAIPQGDRTLTVNGVGDLASHFTNNATFIFHYVDVSIPAGYYDSAIGLLGPALRNALYNIIKGHTSISYSSTAAAFQRTDKRPNGNVWDVYSDVPGGTPPYEFAFGPLGSGGSEGIAYNREHSFPQSWFGGSVSPMYSDLWVIYPTDSKVNSVRSNYPYGKVDSPTFTSRNGSKLGNCVSPNYSGIVFEPIDGYKGDLMRSQFYVATRYLDISGGWPGSDAFSGGDLVRWASDQYMAWSNGDPVSWKERLRNGAIYEYQHNRNPFVDHPEFVAYIYDSTAVIVGVDDQRPVQALQLRQNWPNPFASRTTIGFQLARSENVTLRVYDVTGRTIRTLANGAQLAPGSHQLEWDGRSDGGQPLGPGLYFCQLETGATSATKRMVLAR